MLSRKDLVVLRADVMRELRSFFDERFYVETFPPELTAGPGACENVKAVFTLPYFGRVAFLAQTSQLNLESYLAEMDIDRVYTVFKSFRAEETADDRHLTEFSLFEFEEKSLTLDGLLDLTEQILKRVFQAQSIEKWIHPEARAVISVPQWSRVTYTNAVELIKGKNPGFVWGQDFSSAEEDIIMREYGITFVTHYPTRCKFFNMKISDDNPEVVEACDVLLPGVGEAIGGSVRETDADIIETRLRLSPLLTQLEGIRMEDFNWYISLIRGRAIPRAGAGIGVERVVQFILQEQDIRRCVEFPRNSDILVP